MKRLVILLPVLLALQVGVQPALAWTWPVDGPVLRPFNARRATPTPGASIAESTSVRRRAPAVRRAGRRNGHLCRHRADGRPHDRRSRRRTATRSRSCSSGHVGAARDQEVAEGDVVGVDRSERRGRAPRAPCPPWDSPVRRPERLPRPAGLPAHRRRLGPNPVADPAPAPTPTRGSWQTARDRLDLPGPGPHGYTRRGAVEAVAEAPRRRLGRMIRRPTPARVWRPDIPSRGRSSRGLVRQRLQPRPARLRTEGPRSGRFSASLPRLGRRR